jgi:hypothetical protein
MTSFGDAMLQAAKQFSFEQRKEIWRKDPALWVQERLVKNGRSMYLWSKQAEIGRSIVENKRTVVKSSNGVGKSFLAALLVCWWVDVHPVGKALVVTTAPTYDQVTRILWRYIRMIHAKYKLPGKVLETNEWKINGVLVGFGRKPDDNDISSFQGFHEDYVLAIADEAGGISDTLYTGLEAITTNDYARVLCIGNPDNRGTQFHRTFTNKDAPWTKFTISAYDTPSFTKEKVPADIAKGLTSKNWVEDRIKDWGKEDPRYFAKVLGEFPDHSENTLFSQTTIAKGIDTNIDADADEPTILGVDVARFGVDKTTVYIYQNGHLRLLDAWGQTNTEETANRVLQLAFDNDADEVRVDGVGIGAGVVDKLAARSEDRFITISMVGNGPTPDNAKWFNSRAYWYDNLRQRMADGEIDIDPDDKALKEELEIIQYHFDNPRSVLQIESKKEMRKRGVKSPDYADAAIYASANLMIQPTDPMASLGIGDMLEMTLMDVFGSDFNKESTISIY